MKSALIAIVAAAFVLGSMPADAKGKGKAHSKPPAALVKK